VLLVLGLALVLPAAAEAQPRQPTERQRAEARELYARGQGLYRAGQYAEAEAAFWQAYEVIPNPVVLLGIAEARERAGNVAGAIEVLERYLRERADAPDRASVESRIAGLRTRPATLVITSDPPGARILIDGRDLGYVTPREIEVSPGHHEVSARLGEESASQEVDAVMGMRVDVALDLEPIVEGPEMGDQQPIEEPVTPPVVEEEDEGGGPGTAVWVTAGVAAAALVTGTVLGFLALSEQSEFDENPTESRADRGERFALFADVSFGIAAAAAITGLVLYLTGVGRDDDDDEEPAPADAARLRLRPLAGREAGGMAAQVEF
jgi:tetratricopeptide (TPR) repeat protein